MWAVLLAAIFGPAASAGMTTGFVSYSADTDVMGEGYFAYPSTCTASAKCPAIAIIPDGDGVTAYEMARADLIAQDWGYFAFVVDIFGVNMTSGGMTQDEMFAAITEHFTDPALFVTKMTNGFTQMATYDVVDSSMMGAIGYCFGGTGVLNLALDGIENGMYGVPAGLKGVSSFHATFSGLIDPTAGATHPKISIHTGFIDANGIPPAVMKNLTMALEDKGVDYEVSWYGYNVDHRFTVFDIAAFDEVANSRSWENTRLFFEDLFTPLPAPQGMSIMAEGVTSGTVSYMIDGMNYTGFMAYDTVACTAMTPCPAVAIIPDWNGMNTYEMKRAVLIAKDWHYVAFAMDIYGDAVVESWGGNPAFDDWASASGLHRQNASLYMSKIHAGISLMAGQEVVNASKMAVIGYCFGGSGAINVAMAGHGGTYGIPSGVLAAVSYHAGLDGLIVPEDVSSHPKLATHNGLSDARGLVPTGWETWQTAMETAQIQYDDSYYGPGVPHGFTNWDSQSYHASSELKSWMQTKFMLMEVFGGPESTMTMTATTTAADDEGDESANAASRPVSTGAAAMLLASAFPAARW